MAFVKATFHPPPQARFASNILHPNEYASLLMQLLKPGTCGHPRLFPLPWPVCVNNYQNLFGHFSDLSTSFYLHFHFLRSGYPVIWWGGFLTGSPGSSPVHLCSVLYIIAWMVIPRMRSDHYTPLPWSVSSHCLRLKAKIFNLVYKTHQALVLPTSPWRQRQ